MAVASYNPQMTQTILEGTPRTDSQWGALAVRLKAEACALGFAQTAIVNVDPATFNNSAAEQRLSQWLEQGFHGEMDYMARHGLRRARPAELVPGTLRVIAVRMDYLPDQRAKPADEEANANWIEQGWSSIATPLRATIARYAQGRDYHKVLRARLQKLADWIALEIGSFGYRVFTDSAPVMEVELAQQAGLGWRGKHTLLLSREAGSMFFLGELFVDVPLPVDAPVSDHCGQCTRCMDVCPTQAIVAPYKLDARRCIAYLTIELKGSIPVEFRPLIGNRIYGCDDCQLACPWNKFAQRATVDDFDARGLDALTLVELFAWSEEEFLRHTEGSAIRRIGHERWLRNVAVALGNALNADLAAAERLHLRAALHARADSASALVREHVAWALAIRAV
jgi:epoxyqueuosine reductase